jgi:hypothetical protein
MYVKQWKKLPKRPPNWNARIIVSAEEIKELLGAGFEYVCEKDNLLYFRKRK